MSRCCASETRSVNKKSLDEENRRDRKACDALSIESGTDERGSAENHVTGGIAA